jgi:hypothetical protein
MQDPRTTKRTSARPSVARARAGWRNWDRILLRSLLRIATIKSAVPVRSTGTAGGGEPCPSAHITLRAAIRMT